jgi:hypothetical protein
VSGTLRRFYIRFGRWFHSRVLSGSSLENDDDRRSESGCGPSTASLLPRPKALVVRNVGEAFYLGPCCNPEMLPQVTTPIRPTAVTVGEAVLSGELPGRCGFAGAVEDIRVVANAQFARLTTPAA